MRVALAQACGLPSHHGRQDVPFARTGRVRARRRTAVVAQGDLSDVLRLETYRVEGGLWEHDSPMVLVVKYFWDRSYWNRSFKKPRSFQQPQAFPRTTGFPDTASLVGDRQGLISTERRRRTAKPHPPGHWTYHSSSGYAQEKFRYREQSPRCGAEDLRPTLWLPYGHISAPCSNPTASTHAGPELRRSTARKALAWA